MKNYNGNLMPICKYINQFKCENNRMRFGIYREICQESRPRSPSPPEYVDQLCSIPFTLPNLIHVTGSKLLPVGGLLHIVSVDRCSMESTYFAFTLKEKWIRPRIDSMSIYQIGLWSRPYALGKKSIPFVVCISVNAFIIRPNIHKV